MRNENNYKEIIFYSVSALSYMLIAILFSLIKLELIVKGILAFGFAINHLLLAFLIFNFDIDNGKNKQP